MTNQAAERFKIYKNVFDEFTLQTLFKLSSEDHFDELLSPIMIGKEANIFLAETKDHSYVIVKIYRLASCNFNKMYSYIRSDPRFMSLKNRKRLVIFRWVQREYRNLLLARERLNVPTPIAFSNNVLVMESIGDDRPAPQLKDQTPKDIKGFASNILKQVEDLAELGLVHGDLSEFNILNQNEKPYFIDFSQGTSTQDPNAEEYLKRDLENLARFFRKHKFELDANAHFEKIWKQIKRGRH
ncbi:MAG: serine protein kinase RIO [Nanoarchaeota archaeon]|nr:serine protein kinase RIO [Nanoarchaeota archaeon]